MSLPATIQVPDMDLSESNGDSGFVVTVYDNDSNTVEQVILVLLAATQCPLEEAEMETWEIHHLGKSVVHHGAEDECLAAAAIISQIGIKVTVTQE
jgi:ATP-dependent Clp protease adapter protein ClpS